MAKRISIDSNELDWQPAHEVFPGYRVAAGGPDHGIFVKVLRRPEDGGGCWFCLLRFNPPDGYAIRVTAVAASDEEVFILSDESGHHQLGAFGCNPEGLRHGNTLTGDTVVLAHYHGAPDDVLKAELVELASLQSP